MVAPGSRRRLRSGARTSRRAPGALQVGLHDDRRLRVTDDPVARRLLRALRHGVDPGRVPPEQRALLGQLAEADLLVPVDDAVDRAALRSVARIRLEGPDPLRSAAGRLLLAAGVPESPPRCVDTARLLLTSGAEPRRAWLDDAMRADRPHLVVTEIAGRMRLGPCVVPGLTACLRCVDEHLTDRDPRHPLLVEQHLETDPDDRAPEADRQLALAWAVRDLVALVEGDRPWTWSATVELRPRGPLVRTWTRHPRCGCAWDGALAG